MPFVFKKQADGHVRQGLSPSSTGDSMRQTLHNTVMAHIPHSDFTLLLVQELDHATASCT